MAKISVENLFEQAFAQAGYAASGLAAGVRETLLRYAEDLARQHGFGGAYSTAKHFVADTYGFDLEPDPFCGSRTTNMSHRCMKESGAATLSCS